MPDIVIPYERRPQQRAIHAGLSSRRFGVIVAHRRLGKTVCMLNHLINKAATCSLRAPRFGYVAPLLKQAKTIAWDYLKHYTNPIPNIQRNESDLSVTLPNQARIRLFGSDNPDSMRGDYFDGVVVDETAQIKPEAWLEVIRPMLADRMGWAAFIGTPKGVNLFYELYLEALNNPAGWYCEVFRASETGIIDEEELLALQSTMSESAYRQEFECDFSASDPDILIPLDIVQPAIERELRPHTYQFAPKLVGVDVGGEGEDASVVCVRQGLKLHSVEARQGLKTQEIVNWTAGVSREWSADAVYVDAIGEGAGVYNYLSQLRGINVIPVKASAKASDAKYYNLRIEMWYRMRDWYEQECSIPRNNALIAGTTSPKYEMDEISGKLKLETKKHMREDRGLSSPDEADAVAHTFAYPVEVGLEDDAYEEEEYETGATGY